MLVHGCTEGTWRNADVGVERPSLPSVTPCRRYQLYPKPAFANGWMRPVNRLKRRLPAHSYIWTVPWRTIDVALEGSCSSTESPVREYRNVFCETRRLVW